MSDDEVENSSIKTRKSIAEKYDKILVKTIRGEELTEEEKELIKDDRSEVRKKLDDVEFKMRRVKDWVGQLETAIDELNKCVEDDD